MKQITIRLDEENFRYVTDLKENSLIKNLSLNQILNHLVRISRKEQNNENPGLKSDLRKGAL